LLGFDLIMHWRSLVQTSHLQPTSLVVLLLEALSKFVILSSLLPLQALTAFNLFKVHCTER
jgi:hypothetical protein